MKNINFDVAQALVNYVARDGDSDSLKWGTLSATEIRVELCNIRTKDNKICLQKIYTFLEKGKTMKLVGGANHKIDHLKSLMKTL